MFCFLSTPLIWCHENDMKGGISWGQAVHDVITAGHLPPGRLLWGWAQQGALYLKSQRRSSLFKVWAIQLPNALMADRRRHRRSEPPKAVCMPPTPAVVCTTTSCRIEHACTHTHIHARAHILLKRAAAPKILELADARCCCLTWYSMTQRWNAFKIAFFCLLAQWWSTLPTLWFTSRLGAHLFLTMWHSEPYRESAMMRQITRVPYRALVICPSLHSPASHQWHITAS